MQLKMDFGEQELIHSKIIRDADKLDNFRVKDTENFENNAKKDLHSMWLSFILVTVVT